jgi:hypothetical protein
MGFLRSHCRIPSSLGVLATAETPFLVRFPRDEAGSTSAMVGAMTFGVSGLLDTRGSETVVSAFQRTPTHSRSRPA